ncbi:MAG: hypothetical protein OQK82_08030 [Candidatus Pacearchaeota archaeon]|jgi:hypothetical protein|nr:hypothetical protein [Candidatus Pacearchaeota archaeon]
MMNNCKDRFKRPGRKPLFDEQSVVVAVRLAESDAKKIPGKKSQWIRDCILSRLRRNKDEAK